MPFFHEINMKAAILKSPKNLVVEEVPTPKCPQGGLLVKTKACSICKTDVKMVYHGQKDLVYPRILGHEVTGVVIENQTDKTLLSKYNRNIVLLIEK